MLKATSALPRILALSALLGGIAFATPSFAADDASTTSTSTTTTTKTANHHHAMSPAKMDEDVEARIKTLHEKLMITPEQEDNFNTVAQVMRDNETAMKTLVQDRRASGETRTAVEDLESYQKITAAHADGASKLVDAFKPLYDSLSDDQKKNADQIFGQFEGHRGPMAAGKMAPKSSN